jgi:hypothetical protein
MTLKDQVDSFKSRSYQIRILQPNELKIIKRRGFRSTHSQICESKRNVTGSLADLVQPTANSCVSDAKRRKKIVLNTLLILSTSLDYICGMNQSHYEDIYETKCERCLTKNIELLYRCQMKSFNLFFWEKVNKLPTLIELLNGAVCK